MIAAILKALDLFALALINVAANGEQAIGVAGLEILAAGNAGQVAEGAHALFAHSAGLVRRAGLAARVDRVNRNAQVGCDLCSLARRPFGTRREIVVLAVTEQNQHLTLRLGVLDA